MVKIKVNVKTKNDSIPSDTTKRKMPVITNPKIRRTPRRDDTNVGDIRVKVKAVIYHPTLSRVGITYVYN